MQWVRKTTGVNPYCLAPAWYAEAKAEGASKEQLFRMVKDFCRTVAREDGDNAEPDDALVELMIETYEM